LTFPLWFGIIAAVTEQHPREQDFTQMSENIIGSDDGNCWLPTQAQIDAATSVIRASWSPRTAARRRDLGPDKVVTSTVSKELAKMIDLAMRSTPNA